MSGKSFENIKICLLSFIIREVRYFLQSFTSLIIHSKETKHSCTLTWKGVNRFTNYGGNLAAPIKTHIFIYIFTFIYVYTCYMYIYR